MRAAARHYDKLAWLLTFGRERALRARLADLAQLQPGEKVLDAGCGTGTLAIEAARRVGETGAVFGIDASPEMIATARAKAASHGISVSFEVARAEALPFPDGHFDVVLSSLMLHHLPRATRQAFAQEIRRVLRPSGHVLAVDFEPPPVGTGGFLSHLHRHGHVPLHEIVELLRASGLAVVDTGSVGFGDLQFAMANASDANDVSPAKPAYRVMPPLPRPRWLIPAVVVAIVALHGVILNAAASVFTFSGLAGLAVLGVALLKHGVLAGGVHAMLRRRRGITPRA